MQSMITFYRFVSKMPFIVGSPEFLKSKEIISSKIMFRSWSPWVRVTYKVYRILCCMNKYTSFKLSSKVWSMCFLSSLRNSTMHSINRFNLKQHARIRLTLNSTLMTKKYLQYSFSTFKTEHIVLNLVFTDWFFESLYSTLKKLYNKIRIYIIDSAISTIHGGVGISCYYY